MQLFELDFDEIFINGKTPFLISIAKKKLQLAKYFLKLGANPFASDLKNRNALHFLLAVNNAKNVEICNWLLDSIPSFKINQQREDEITALHLAAMSGDV